MDSSNSACANIRWLKGRDITKPADGLYHPTSSVTRGSMAAFLFRVVNPGEPQPDCHRRPFPDVAVGSTFCGYIAWAKNNQVAYGYPDGTYGPNNPVTRGAMAAYLHRITTDERTPTCHRRPFADVPVGSTFCGVITWMENNAITYGVGDGKYGTTLPVTRQAMASFLHRIYDLRTSTTPNKITYKTFTKDTTIPRPATKRINDSSMYVGQSKTVQQGHPGTRRTTYKQKYVNGAKSGHPVKTGSKTMKAAVATVIHDGTKPKQLVENTSLAAQVAALVNQKRAAAGVAQLTVTSSSDARSCVKHSASAQANACDPGTLEWGGTTASAVVSDWMNSPPHRATMLDEHVAMVACYSFVATDGMPWTGCVFGGFAA